MLNRALLFLLFAGTAFAQLPKAAPNASGSGGGGGSGTVTSVVIAGTANEVTAAGTCTITTTGTCTLSVPSAFVLPGTIDGLTITTTTGTLTITGAKVLTVSNSLTLAGTDNVTLTFPATNATIARTDAGQTFTGVQAFSSSPTMPTPAQHSNNTNGADTAYVDVGLATKGPIGEFLDATPGASPTYNFATGIAAGTSSIMACTGSTYPCNTVNMTLSANSTAPAFTFGTVGGADYYFIINQGGTAYTGFTWPANVIGGAPVTTSINKYTVCHGAYDTNLTAVTISSCSTNDYAQITGVTGPTSGPGTAATAFNWMDSHYNVPGIWPYQNAGPIYPAVPNEWIRQTFRLVASNATFNIWGNSISQIGSLSGVNSTSTTPYMTGIAVPSGGNGATAGSQNLEIITGRTQGIRADCIDRLTVITTIRAALCAITNVPNNQITSADDIHTLGSSAVGIFFCANSGACGSPLSASAVNYLLCSNDGTVENCVNTNVSVAANAMHHFSLYEDIANSQWRGCVDTTCVTINTHIPAANTTNYVLASATGIGGTAGSLQIATIEAASDFY